MQRRDRLVLKYRKAMDWARTYLAAPVVVIYYYSGVETDCTTCAYDPVNEESIDPDCAECSGAGKVKEEKTLTVNANVSWQGISNEYAINRLSGGKIEEGDVVVSCKLADVLTDVSNTASATYFDNANYVKVNNRKCKVLTTPLRYGLAGDLYNCAVVLVLDED